MITLVQLQYFQIVAELQHITRAAETLNVSQTAVSAVLARLESELDTKLFDKDGRNIRLNEQGQLFKPFADNILTQVDEARRVLTMSDRSQKETIVCSLLAAEYYYDIFCAFQIKHPHVRLVHKEYPAFELQAKINCEEIDFAIEGSLLPDLTNLAYYKLADNRIYVAIPKNHPLADRETVKATDIQHESFCALCPANTFRQICDAICYRAGFIPNIVSECSDSTLLGHTASSLNTLFFCGAQRIITQQKDERFCFVPLDEPDASHPMIIYWKKGRKLSDAQVQFLDIWKKRYAEKLTEENPE